MNTVYSKKMDCDTTFVTVPSCVFLPSQKDDSFSLFSYFFYSIK
ncbi:hypothetical protein HMPREF9526_02645 [Enterococcus faecium TX0133B]|nr:hypothetical protein HMPREF9526_02645 [Enterococcus faecium TX0133B]